MTYCQGCGSRCSDCPYEVHQPQSVEGQDVWRLVGRLQGQYRFVPMGGPVGFDFGAAFELARAMQICLSAVAEFLPIIERVAIARRSEIQSDG